MSDNVPLPFINALLEQAARLGKNVNSLLRTANLPFDSQLNEYYIPEKVSSDQYNRLCLALFEVLQDESGGMMRGLPTPVGACRLLMQAIIYCRDLREAMHRAIEFNAVCREPEGCIKQHCLVEDKKSRLATLSYLSRPTADDNQYYQVNTLCAVAIWLRVCAWLIGRDIDIIDAGCVGPPLADRPSLRHFFRCPVQSQQSSNWVHFSSTLLDAPIVRSDKDLPVFLKSAPFYTVVKPMEYEQSVSSQIRKIIGEDLQNFIPFDQLTYVMHMSARTLRRRLDREGTSYQRIKDTTRRDVAIKLLENPALTVSDVAEKVGFSDSSAFHRSFKRWTGSSPGQYHQ